MGRWLTIAFLFALLFASSAAGQTRLMFFAGEGDVRQVSGNSVAVVARGAGIEFHLQGQAWIGVEVSVLSGTRRGSEPALAIPVDLYGYLTRSTRLMPFLTIGYTSIDILGSGLDLGGGLDVPLSKHISLRCDVRVLEVFDKSGTDQAGFVRIGGFVGWGP